MINSATAVSGSGPAYVFHMVGGAVRRRRFGRGSRQGIRGSSCALPRSRAPANCSTSSDLGANVLRQNVTWPKGHDCRRAEGSDGRERRARQAHARSRRRRHPPLARAGEVAASLSSRASCPGSISPLAPASVDSWIPVTSTGMTASAARVPPKSSLVKARRRGLRSGIIISSGDVKVASSSVRSVPISNSPRPTTTCACDRACTSANQARASGGAAPGTNRISIKRLLQPSIPMRATSERQPGA